MGYLPQESTIHLDRGYAGRRTETLLTDHALVVRFYLSLAAALVVTRCLIREARTRFRGDGRPTTRRLK